MSEGRRAYGRRLCNRQPACRPLPGILAAGAMTKGDAKSLRDKEERLAAALRENLRRRKAQSREAQAKTEPTKE